MGGGRSSKSVTLRRDEERTLSTRKRDRICPEVVSSHSVIGDFDDGVGEALELELSASDGTTVGNDVLLAASAFVCAVCTVTVS